MPISPGERLGIYEILRPLGAGGMGEVYLARDTRLRREVAIKVLPAGLAADREWRTRLVREAQVLASLNHPGIATIHSLEESPDGTHYLVLERVEGDTLASRLAQGPLSAQECLDVCGQIAVALEAAHTKGVVHRDLKPGNVMLTPAGWVKLLDFGLASSSGAGVGAESTSRVPAANRTTSAEPGTSIVMGTPGYMSPEQVRGEEQDRRTDIFSFGCVLYECLSGRRAFVGKTAPEAMGAVLYATPDLGALPGGTPGAIRLLLDRCLEKDPSRRLRDIGDARMEIEDAKETRAARTMPTIAAPLHNLPKPRTSFVGREKELAECAQLLEENRVLTLTGVGGSGKTRLALKIAEGRVGAHEDGTWFVDLAPIQDEDRVAVAVATVLGVKEEPGGSLIESLSARLTEKDALLVLDNCEHVLAASTELAEALLAAAPNLRLLATSREGLGLDGERLFAVRSLGVPRREDWHDARALEASEAIHLFVDRARAVEGRFALDGKNGPIVAEICRRLDGIPLAIELAASRVKVLSVDQIRSKLDDRFRLLTGGSKTALPRHQTLRATVQWSYDQLADEERELLQRLAVFAGGWTLESGTAVAAESADEFEILDRLTRLVDKSLVVVELEGGGQPRYRMLETVRQYAEERLSESGAGAAARSRHLDFYLSFALVAEPGLLGADQGEWKLRIDAELENLLSAIAWCGHVDAGAVKGIRLLFGLRNYWETRGLNELGSRVTREALARDTGDDALEERGRLMNTLGSMLMRRGLIEDGLSCSQEALAIAERTRNPHIIQRAHRGVGVALMLLGRPEEARTQLMESLRIGRELDNPSLLSGVLVALGELERGASDLAAAHAYYNEAYSLSMKAGDLGDAAIMCVNLAMVAISRTDPDTAHRHLAEGIQLVVKATDKHIGMSAINTAGALAAMVGDYPAAARFFGVADEARLRMGVVFEPWDIAFTEPYLTRTRSKLGDAAFAAAERAGRTVPYESALAEVRARVEKYGNASPLLDSNQAAFKTTRPG
jgi:predicted ATPase